MPPNIGIWYWTHKRRGSLDKKIHLSSVDQYYPTKSDMISDRHESDSGGNFGRLARAGVMEDYIAELFDREISRNTTAGMATVSFCLHRKRFE